jgi:hypothetical protein
MHTQRKSNMTQIRHDGTTPQPFAIYGCSYYIQRNMVHTSVKKVIVHFK